MTGLEDLCTVQLCYREIWWLLTDSNRVLRIFSPVHRPSLPKSHMARVERFELPYTVLETVVLPLNDTLICDALVDASVYEYAVEIVAHIFDKMIAPVNFVHYLRLQWKFIKSIINCLCTSFKLSADADGFRIKDIT